MVAPARVKKVPLIGPNNNPPTIVNTLAGNKKMVPNTKTPI